MADAVIAARSAVAYGLTPISADRATHLNQIPVVSSISVGGGVVVTQGGGNVTIFASPAVAVGLAAINDAPDRTTSIVAGNARMPETTGGAFTAEGELEVAATPAVAYVSLSTGIVADDLFVYQPDATAVGTVELSSLTSGSVYVQATPAIAVDGLPFMFGDVVVQAQAAIAYASVESLQYVSSIIGGSVRFAAWTGSSANTSADTTDPEDPSNTE